MLQLITILSSVILNISIAINLQDPPDNRWAEETIQIISLNSSGDQDLRRDVNQRIDIYIRNKHFYYNGIAFDGRSDVAYSDLVKRIAEMSGYYLYIIISQDEPFGRFNNLGCLLGENLKEAKEIYVVF